MYTTQTTVEQPQTIEGILVRNDYRFGAINIEISPDARVITEVHKRDEEGKVISSTSLLEGYDQSNSTKARIKVSTPNRSFPRVRLTQTREDELQEDDKGYRLDSYVKTVLEDLEEGGQEEVRLLDFTNSSKVFYRRTLEGVLEPLPEETVSKKSSRERDPNSCTVIGIRSYNRKNLTPVVVYASPDELGIEDSYGHSVRLEEGIWRHQIGGLGHEDTFDQKLTDLETEKVYEGGQFLHGLSPRKILGWKAQAREIQKQD